MSAARGALHAAARPAPPVAPSAYPFWLAALAGLAMVMGSWLAVSGQAAFPRQVGYLNVAVGGLVVITGGAGAYLVEYRRQIRCRIVRVTNAESR